MTKDLVWLRDRPVRRELYDYVMAQVAEAGPVTPEVAAKLAGVVTPSLRGTDEPHVYEHEDGTPVD